MTNIILVWIEMIEYIVDSIFCKLTLSKTKWLYLTFLKKNFFFSGWGSWLKYIVQGHKLYKSNPCIIRIKIQQYINT